MTLEWVASLQFWLLRWWVSKQRSHALSSLQKALLVFTMFVGGCVVSDSAIGISEAGQKQPPYRDLCIFAKYTPENGWPVFPVIPMINNSMAIDRLIPLVINPGDYNDVLSELISKETGLSVKSNQINGYLISECN